MSKHLTVVVPVKNESGSLKMFLDQIPEFVSEIIVVDGNSTDNSFEIASTHARVSRVVKQLSRGKGAALSMGFALAKGDLVAIIDADGSMEPTELAKFIAFFPEFDVVKGSRYLEGGGSTDLTLFRSVGNKILTGLANFLFKTNWTDMAYGFAVFTRESVESLALTNFDKLGSFLGHKSYGQGFEIETLMFCRAAKRNLKIKEIASFESDRVSGSSNLRAIRDGFRVLAALLIESLRSQSSDGR
jgi:glycosyltransferase involved in cell wall biosynthesis